MLTLVPRVHALAARVQRRDRNLADHIRRASSSVVLNHAEADGCRGGNRRNRVQIAQGELCELRTALALALASHYLAADEVAALDPELDRVAAMTYRRWQAAR
jgi:four helix bundle protein